MSRCLSILATSFLIATTNFQSVSASAFLPSASSYITANTPSTNQENDRNDNSDIDNTPVDEDDESRRNMLYFAKNGQYYQDYPEDEPEVQTTGTAVGLWAASVASFAGFGICAGTDSFREGCESSKGLGACITAWVFFAAGFATLVSAIVTTVQLGGCSGTDVKSSTESDDKSSTVSDDKSSSGDKPFYVSVADDEERKSRVIAMLTGGSDIDSASGNTPSFSWSILGLAACGLVFVALMALVWQNTRKPSLGEIKEEDFSDYEAFLNEEDAECDF